MHKELAVWYMCYYLNLVLYEERLAPVYRDSKAAEILISLGLKVKAWVSSSSLQTFAPGIRLD